MNVLKELSKMGISKYRIAKETGVSWNSVAFWYLGIYKPKVENYNKLIDLYNKLTVKGIL